MLADQAIDTIRPTFSLVDIFAVVLFTISNNVAPSSTSLITCSISVFSIIAFNLSLSTFFNTLHILSMFSLACPSLFILSLLFSIIVTISSFVYSLLTSLYVFIASVNPSFVSPCSSNSCIK